MGTEMGITKVIMWARAMLVIIYNYVDQINLNQIKNFNN